MSKPLGYVAGDRAIIFYRTGFQTGAVLRVSGTGYVTVSYTAQSGEAKALRFTPRGRLFGDSPGWSSGQTHLLPKDDQDARASQLRREYALGQERRDYRDALTEFSRRELDDSTRAEIAAALREFANKVEKGP